MTFKNSEKCVKVGCAWVSWCTRCDKLQDYIWEEFRWPGGLYLKISYSRKIFNKQTEIDDNINYASVHAFSVVIDFTPRFVHRSSPLPFSWHKLEFFEGAAQPFSWLYIWLWEMIVTNPDRQPRGLPVVRIKVRACKYVCMQPVWVIWCMRQLYVCVWPSFCKESFCKEYDKYVILTTQGIDRMAA